MSHENRDVSTPIARTTQTTGMGRVVLNTAVARLLSMLLGLATLGLTAHYLGPAGRGVLVTVSTWVTLFATLSSLSLGQVALHRSAGVPVGDWLAPVFGALLLATAAGSVLGWIVAVGVYSCSTHLLHGLPLVYVVTAFISLPLVLWEQYNAPLLMAVNAVALYNTYQIVGRLVGVIAVVAVLLARFGVEGALWAWFLTNALLAAGGFRHLWRLSGRPTLRLDESRRLLIGGAKLHLNAVGNVLFSGVDILLLHHFRGSAPTAYYQLALQLTTMFMLIPQAATMVLYSAVSAQGPDAAWHAQRKIVVAIVGLMVGICLVSYVVAPWAIVTFLGVDFAPSILLFRWLLLGVVGMTLSTLLAPQWIGRGLFLQTSLLTLAIGIANVSLNLALIPRYGALGAVWGTLAVYFISIVGNGSMALYCEVRYRRIVAG